MRKMREIPKICLIVENTDLHPLRSEPRSSRCEILGGACTQNRDSLVWKRPD